MFYQRNNLSLEWQKEDSTGTGSRMTNMTARAREPRSRNRAQRQCKKANCGRVQCWCRFQVEKLLKTTRQTKKKSEDEAYMSPEAAEAARQQVDIYIYI